jgi:hypothetical protein
MKPVITTPEINTSKKFDNMPTASNKEPTVPVFPEFMRLNEQKNFSFKIRMGSK